MLTVQATYGFPGDCCFVATYGDGRCLGTAFGPWSKWELVERQLRNEGPIAIIDRPGWGFVIVPLPGGRINVPGPQMDYFCDQLLEALYNAEVDKRGGAVAYYNRSGRRAVLDGGCYQEERG